MNFLIERTSIRGSFEMPGMQPCKEASIKSLTRLDARAAETLSEARKKPWYNEWYNGGINHREENGYVVCDLKEKEKVWTIEIDTLDQLMELQQRYGDLVISDDLQYKEELDSIEIYDMRRE